jgi:PAS domain S-box-containing protein
MNENKKLTLEYIGAFLDKLAEKSDSIYWLSSYDFKKIQYISPAYEKVWGRSRQELYDEPELWITFLHPDDAKSHHPIHDMAARIETLGPKARYDENYRIIRPNGETRWIIDRGFPIYDDAGNCCGVTGVAVDITKEKQPELVVIKKAKEAAEAANQAKTQFLESMRYNIRTPLSGIVAFAELLKGEADDPEKVIEYADNLIVASYALTDFLNDVLDTIHASDGTLPITQKKFALKALLLRVVQLHQPKALTQKLTLSLQHDPNIPNYLLGDLKRVYRIVLELVTNALKFTKRGTIMVRSKLVKHAAQQCIVQIEVKDSGIGIPHAQQEAMLSYFNRMLPTPYDNAPGAGLGLSLVKQFIQDLQGELYIKSEPDQGSTFSCLFPFSIPLTDDGLHAEDLEQFTIDNLYTHQAHISEAQFPNNKPTASQKVPQVLLIEDNLIAAEASKATLMQLGCEVEVAQQGEVGVRQAYQNAYDIIFMDIRLPDLHGNLATRRIRAREQRSARPVPIIGTTGHIDAVRKQECIEAGMHAVLIKPLTRAQIEDMLVAFIPQYERKSTYQQLPPTSLNTGLSWPQVTQNILDWSYGTRYADGKLTIAKELMRMLVKSLPKTLGELEVAHTEKNWKDVATIVEELYSSSQHCACRRLTEACDYLINELKSGSYQHLEPLYQQVVNEIQALIKAVKKAL